jgi:hypothetical protein
MSVLIQLNLRAHRRIHLLAESDRNGRGPSIKKVPDGCVGVQLHGPLECLTSLESEPLDLIRMLQPGRRWTRYAEIDPLLVHISEPRERSIRNFSAQVEEK